MTPPRGTSSNGGISVEKFYQAQDEIKNQIHSLELRLVDEISQLKDCIPPKKDIIDARDMAEKAINRTNDLDRKTNWFGGITLAVMTAIGYWTGTK